MLVRKSLYGDLRVLGLERYAVTEAGCGLCQTKVPCESRSPPGRRVGAGLSPKTSVGRRLGGGSIGHSWSISRPAAALAGRHALAAPLLQ